VGGLVSDPLLTPEAWQAAAEVCVQHNQLPLELGALRAFLAAHDPEAKADQYNAERHDGELASVSRDLLYDFAHWLIDGKDFLGLGGDDA
jgi:hypothetical protein